MKFASGGRPSERRGCSSELHGRPRLAEIPRPWPKRPRLRRPPGRASLSVAQPPCVRMAFASCWQRSASSCHRRQSAVSFQLSLVRSSQAAAAVARLAGDGRSPPKASCGCAPLCAQGQNLVRSHSRRRSKYWNNQPSLQSPSVAFGSALLRSRCLKM